MKRILQIAIENECSKVVTCYKLNNNPPLYECMYLIQVCILLMKPCVIALYMLAMQRNVL